jgi:hypothetical protein
VTTRKLDYWIEPKRDAQQVHVLWFDPGGITGWAHLCFALRGFSRPSEKALRWLTYWQCGEFAGSEADQCDQAIQFAWQARFHERLSDVHVGTEDFDLVQTRGGKELLSPVRINAVLEYNLSTYSIPLRYQRRADRMHVTPQRLRAFGFEGKWTTTGKGKDAYAAMQHAVLYTQRLKVAADKGIWRQVNHKFGL